MTDFKHFKPDTAVQVLKRELAETDIVQNIDKKLKNRLDDVVDLQVARMKRDDDLARPKPKVTTVWLRYGIDPKTKKRIPVVLGVHGTQQSAQLALPEEFQTLARKYPPDSPYIQNYLNKTLEARQVEM